MIRHVVLFSYDKALDSQEIKELHSRFCRLPELIEEIASFESGHDISVEGKSHGYAMAYVLGFKGTPERDRYLVHPRHREFSEYAGPYLKDVLVLDYEAEETATPV